MSAPSSAAADTTIFVDGLSFPESPRWRDGRLYLSDMGTSQVLAVDPGTAEVSTVVAKVPGAPSGLTWDDHGALQVVSMGRSIIYRDEGGDRLVPWCDLSTFVGGWRNDAVRHPAGWLYVGAVGADDNLADLVVIDASGSPRVAARGLDSPNGMVITPDGSTLVVSEHHAGRLTALTVADDGTLTDRRAWASDPAWVPDGICLDAHGAIWMASADEPVVRRVADGGAVLATVRTSQPAYACMLGGHDRRTLFVCSAPGSTAEARGRQGGRIETVRVDTPGAGFP